MPVQNCSCGKPKPYRRAYACRVCWNALVPAMRLALETNQKDQRTLRLKEIAHERRN